MPLANTPRFVLDFTGGDGDQSLFGTPFLAQVTSSIWSADDGRERLSARVLNGPCAGEAIHIGSRTIETLREQFDNRRYLSVVVYRQDDPSPVGMAAPELIRRNG